ncbi:MAG: hypothetical protein M3437_15795 [Chloroflexota bacterium]|nr:hypothetical protein [Chloroflexota bacterium]MDQ5865084.1 hypothetical protein [Chloroflexota bacterium]
MKIKRIVVIGCMFVVIGMGGMLAGCGEQPTGAGSGQDQSAKDQFLAERQGTVTPGAGGQGDLALPGVMGTVEKVEGNKLTIKNPIDNSTSIVELANGGKVTKQADGQASDIKVGDDIGAFGSKNGNALEAEVVSLGGDLAGGDGGPVRIERPTGDNTGDYAAPAPGGGFQAGPGGGDMIDAGGMPEFVSGTVEKIDGSTLTVKTKDGTATVRLTESTKVHKQVEIALSDLQVGEMILATGSRQGDTFKATAINVPGGMVGMAPGNTP